ncbi:hypothetical protein [Mycobacterium intracellulare]|uniref:hypothetical protein n=1 Tax=Mycobacterium intracellulare TaxID=1767 RepID=UPI0034D487A3
MLGGNVCRVHGGAAPQTRAKAQRRLQQAADVLVQRLLGLALDGDVPDAIALQAIRDALDRAGLGAKHALELSAKPLAPWEEMCIDFANTSRARHEALEQLVRRGEALPEVLANPAGPDIVDAELVLRQETDDHSPRTAVRRADRPDAADVPADKSATPEERVAPPPRELNQDEAADVMRCSRVPTNQIRRKGRNRRAR